MPATDSDWKNQEDAQVLARLATAAALSANWDEAAKINQKILNRAENNVEALNRLARALYCLGEPAKAQKIYKKVLELDPYNTIAKKNLDKIEKSLPLTKHNGNDHLTNGKINGNPQSFATGNLASLFLQEPGKTKVISLLNIAPPQVLALLNPGEQLIINPKNHGITISTQNGIYLGALPDDLAHRMLAFIAGGNKYEAYVKSASVKNLVVLIKEVWRSERFINQPSFQGNNPTILADENI